MKVTCLFLCFWFTQFCAYAQMDIEQIASQEQKQFLQLHKGRALSQGNINVTQVKLELQVNPHINYLHGQVTTHLISIEDLTYIEFDLTDSLTVDSIIFHSVSLPFSRPGGHVIYFNFPDPILANQLDSISIFYQGIPSRSGFGSFVQGKHDSVPIIWTLSEPYGAKDWWPCRQNLIDKIDSLDVLLTIPDTCKAASNGLLILETPIGNQKIVHWKHRYPIATYLVAFAVTNYSLYSDWVPRNTGTLEIQNFVYPEHLDKAQLGTSSMAPMVHLFDSLFGAYPFENEKYGHAEFGWGGGMEHQTMTFVTNFGFDLLSHELAHQWFGNKVTCNSWHDLWLNEGFATYLTGLCFENIEPQYWAIWKLQTKNSSVVIPDGSVWCEDTANISRLFSGRLTYSKGAMVLHQLRYLLGDSVFYLSLKNYLYDANHAYKFSLTDDLRAHFEAVSGKDLIPYFNQFIYGKGYPIYQLEWSQNFENEVHLKIEQTQSDASLSFFKMPLQIRFKNQSNDTTILLDHEFSGQNFTFKLPFVADSLYFDPATWLVAKDSVIRNSDYDFDMRIYPNPIQDKLQVRVEVATNTTSQIYIYNTIGQRVFDGGYDFNKGYNKIEIDSRNFEAGIYQLVIKSGDKKKIASFVKINK